MKDTSSKPTSVFAVYNILNGVSNVKRRKWLLWFLLPVGLVVGNCQVIPESRSPETLITTPILTLAPTFTTTSTLQATATPVPKQAPMPVPEPTDAEPQTLLAKVAVEAVELRQLESLPIQIQLFIKGNLPDDCEYELIATQAREGQMIRVTLQGQRPADLSCTIATQSVTYALRLEGGFEPGDYTLAVNDYQMSFSVSVEK